MPVYLGIDPGLATVGFGVVHSDSGKLSYVDCGTIKTAAGLEFPERLAIIKKDIDELLETFKPDVVGIEELFFVKNVTSGMKVAHARGVIVESVYSHGVPMIDFTPLQVKNNIAGHGSADKWQVQEMVKRFLNLPRHPKPDDAADALAIAICAERVYQSPVPTA